MKHFKLQVFVVYWISVCYVNVFGSKVVDFLRSDYEDEMVQSCTYVMEKHAEYSTDLMNYRKEHDYVEGLLDQIEKHTSLRRKVFALPQPVPDGESMMRELKFLSKGNELEGPQLEKYVGTYVEIEKNFTITKICPYKRPHCGLEKRGISLYEIEEVMATSTDYDELTYLWTRWRDTVVKFKYPFKTYVDLSNKSAIANKLTNAAEYETRVYEIKNIEEEVMKLWQKIEPLYTELHKYVGRKLKERYGDKMDFSDGLIPAHILGNMWGESWYPLESLVRPFPNVTEGKLEHNLKRRFKVVDMFRAADEMYSSMGLLSMTQAFMGPDGMLTKPNNEKEVLCNIRTYDNCDRNTFRTYMCGKVNFEDFIKIHQELGHVQYSLQYGKLPYILRNSPSPQFRIGVSESVVLAAVSISHLRNMDLLDHDKDTYETNINHLMKIALIKVASLPFGLIADLWRWDVQKGKVPLEQWNSHWWEYRKKYQKVKPPVPRSEDHFDPASNYHVAVQSGYMPYFLGYIMGFQIYKSLCMAAVEYQNDLYTVCPLYYCNLYNSTHVGNKLQRVLSEGNQMSWQTCLYTLTNYQQISAEPLLEYFQPLYNYLKKENARVENMKSEQMPEHEDHTITITVSVIIIIISVIILALILIRYLNGRPMIFR